MGKSSICSIGSDLVANNFGKLDHFITVKIIFINQKGSSLLKECENQKLVSMRSDLVANNFGKLDHFITVKILITNQKGSSVPKNGSG
jgi:hypothetical protein